MEHKIDLTELTLSLASLMSVTGHTRYSKDKLLEIVSPYFDEIRETRLGCYHLIRRCGKENAQKILVDAHFDEIGMIVTEIKENGFLTVTSKVKNARFYYFLKCARYLPLGIFSL